MYVVPADDQAGTWPYVEKDHRPTTRVRDQLHSNLEQALLGRSKARCSRHLPGISYPGRAVLAEALLAQGRARKFMLPPGEIGVNARTAMPHQADEHIRPC